MAAPAVIILMVRMTLNPLTTWELDNTFSLIILFYPSFRRLRQKSWWLVQGLIASKGLSQKELFTQDGHTKDSMSQSTGQSSQTASDQWWERGAGPMSSVVSHGGHWFGIKGVILTQPFTNSSQLMSLSLNSFICKCPLYLTHSIELSSDSKK